MVRERLAVLALAFFSLISPTRADTSVFHEDRWHWDCMAQALHYCNADDDFVVQKGTLYCSHEIIDHSLNPPDTPTQVRAIDGGIHALRYIQAGVTTRAWFDSTVIVRTIDKNATDAEKQQCTSLPDMNAKLTYGLFCTGDSLPEGWVALRLAYDEKCPKSSTGADNAYLSALASSVPAGYEADFCSVSQVPAGWQDLGLKDDQFGSCEHAPGILARHNKVRRMRRP